MRFFRWIARQLWALVRWIFRRWGGRIALGLIVLYLWLFEPEILPELAVLGIMIFGLRVMVSGIWPMGKKKK